VFKHETKCPAPNQSVSANETNLNGVTALSFVNRPLLCHPERTRISYFTALTGATYVVLPKENHMQLTEAATLNRKSGGAEGSAVLFTGNQGFGHPRNRSPL